MAHKRMFSKSITTSDAFREMPASSQALYFHLGMEADDDGFLDNYRGMMRSINASDDDFKILIGKRFLILFPSKVVVVKHWKINNDIKKDRYHETKHLEEKRALIIKENGAYTEREDVDTERIQDVSNLETQYRIEEDRTVGADRAKKDTSYSLVFDIFSKKKQGWMMHKTQIEAAKRLLELKGAEEVKKAMDFYDEHKGEQYLPEIHTPFDLEAKWSKLFSFAGRV